MKILVLDFRNAGWFYKNVSKYDEKDFVFDLNGKIKRKDLKKQYIEPITSHQVSNVLHVLFGERPSASLRKTHIKEIPEIKTMALEGWLKINDFCIKSKKENITFFKEKVRTKKAVWNSWEPNNTLLYWKRIELFLGEELYEEFIQLIKLVLKVENPTNTFLTKTIEIIHDNFLEDKDIQNFLEKLAKNGKTPLCDTIKNKNFKNSEFNKNSRTMITINSGISELIRLSGKIIIPIKDEKWIERLKKSQGVARILDGGLVTVYDLLDMYDFNDAYIIGFKKISEISNELIK
jgi:hypothetical protein